MVGQDYRQIDNFVYNGITYSLLIKQNDSQKNFTIKISKGAGNTNEQESGVSLVYDDYKDEIFCNTLNGMMLAFDARIYSQPSPATVISIEPNDLKTKWVSIYKVIYKQITKTEVITELYDKQDIEYSAEIVLKKSPVKLTFDGNSNYSKFKKDLKHKTINNIKISSTKIKTKIKTEIKNHKKDNLTFIPQYASIRFFNNRINKIAVVGTINDKQYTVHNNLFSIPFRYLTSNGSTLSIEVEGYFYTMEWNDLLDLLPIDTEFNYAVKNKNYKVLPGEPVKIESRNLFDYFTAVVFSDFLGLNNSSNSLLAAEGRVIIPLALVNSGRWNTPQYFETYLNTSVYNGQEQNISAITWDGTSKINSFDFFKSRNIEAGINVGLLSFEWRGISSTFTFDYGAQFYRTKLIQKIGTEQETVQMYAIGHGPKLKIEIRPQMNFGADLNVGLLGYNFNGFNKTPTTTADFKHDILQYDRTLYNTLFVVTNLYTKLNDKESNGGLYFRLGAYYDFKTYDVSPQIMVGYATNLTSFINKFKKKNETVPVAASTP